MLQIFLRNAKWTYHPPIAKTPLMLGKKRGYVNSFLRRSATVIRPGMDPAAGSTLRRRCGFSRIFQRSHLTISSDSSKDYIPFCLLHLQPSPTPLAAPPRAKPRVPAPEIEGPHVFRSRISVFGLPHECGKLRAPSPRPARRSAALCSAGPLRKAGSQRGTAFRVARQRFLHPTAFPARHRGNPTPLFGYPFLRSTPIPLHHDPGPLDRAAPNPDP